MNEKDNFIIVIFGASGDLAWRKLIPALYSAYYQSLLSEKFAIVGVGRSALTDEVFHRKMTEGLEQFVPQEFNDSEKFSDFCEKLFYHSMETDKKDDYQELKIHLDKLSATMECRKNYLFYFAIPPLMYAQVAQYLHYTGLTDTENGWKRVIVEKPFGHDYESAVKLNGELLEYFTEDQIYR
ncbi:MAG: glucose-6-phosphate dehydrogenase, partial [Tannerella sp.]|nr:glucose-6-phosphate dehydrogenase [Tannerella sp.]